MKVLFPDITNPGSGRSFFLNALAKELPKQGVEVVFDGEHDVSLHSIRMWCKSKRPRILRLDGVYHDTGKDWKAKNESLKHHADSADGIVCQSEFSKQMVMRFLGVPEEKIQVIFNGALFCEFPVNIAIANHHYIAASKWRPHKRLDDIIESFLIADIDKSLLTVIGDLQKSGIDSDRYLRNPRIRILGQTDHDKLVAYYMGATASVHLCWFDACPNSVVEAIVAGCPVICNNTGGTHEIVRPSGGIVLNLDEPYDYRPVDLYHPPKIDRNKVAEAMRKCAESRPVITSDHVNIENIAGQYKTFFERFA